LIEERERACDEEVLGATGTPQIYAEAILSVCKRYVPVPSPAIAGVSGANLRARLEAIVADRVGRPLSGRKKILLTIAAAAVLALPIAAGARSSQQSDHAARTSDTERPAFEVTSVKPTTKSEGVIRLDIQPGGRFAMSDTPLKQVIRAAYTLQLYQIVDAPSWVDSERFDIAGVSDRELREPSGTWNPGQYQLVQLMMQSLLADRFNFRAHFEEREGQIYALVRDRTERAPTLTPAKPCGTDCQMQIAAGTLRARSVDMPQFAELLSQLTGRLVTDATGLDGAFEFSLRWTPESQEATSDAPSLFTALREQLGLRLEARRGPTKMLVVDSVDRPTSN
jgi:bla regulator protein blaR1